jgi:hypothetical protein
MGKILCCCDAFVFCENGSQKQIFSLYPNRKFISRIIEKRFKITKEFSPVFRIGDCCFGKRFEKAVTIISTKLLEFARTTSDSKLGKDF